MACTIQLKSSHLPAHDQWYLDGNFLLVIQQREFMAAGRGEMQAEVHCINQMAWHLNTLPSGMRGLNVI